MAATQMFDVLQSSIQALLPEASSDMFSL